MKQAASLQNPHFVSALEESGRLARANFVMDRLMKSG
jgi:Fe2+ transport system protein B